MYHDRKKKKKSASKQCVIFRSGKLDRGDPDRYDLVGKTRFKNTGLVATLISALLFEISENSEVVINLFRENTGKGP